MRTVAAGHAARTSRHQSIQESRRGVVCAFAGGWHEPPRGPDGPGSKPAPGPRCTWSHALLRDHGAAAQPNGPELCEVKHIFG
jgi:hypothetical protein